MCYFSLLSSPKRQSMILKHAEPPHLPPVVQERPMIGSSVQEPFWFFRTPHAAAGVRVMRISDLVCSDTTPLSVVSSSLCRF